MALDMTSVDIDNRMTKTRRNLFTALILITVFVGSTCFSVLSPIYPDEAEKKGLQPTQYGFVFGVFQLIIFLMSPVYGRYIKLLGSAFLFKTGIFITAWCTILFGFLDKSPPGNTFLYLSIAVRGVGAFGEAAVYISSYVIAIRCQPQAVATALSLVETAFGVGGILGPTFGGALYEIGGFTLPFFIIGIVMMVLCLLSVIFIKEINDVQPEGGPTLRQVLHIPTVYMLSYTVLLGSISCGFITAFLEPQLKTIGITPFKTGLIFIAFGGTYAIAALIWGRIVEKLAHFRLFTLAGLALYIVSFLLLGPATFLPLEPTVTLTVISLVLAGFGLASLLVCSALGIMDDIIANGSPKNLQTQGFVSGLYNTLFAAGAFIGPTVGGPLYDTIGFANSTLVIWGLTWLAILILGVYELVIKCRVNVSQPNLKTPLCQNNMKNYSGSLPHLAWTYAVENESIPDNN